MIALTLILVVLLFPVAVLTAFWAIEMLAGLRPLESALIGTGHVARAIIVIPAHNEEALITETVASIRRQIGNRYSILVVADNCTDRTSDLARSAGAMVIVRDEPDQRGKGFALAAARERLLSNPPEVVIIIDADCRIAAASLSALVRRAADSARACQAVYLFTPDLTAPPLVQISNFAFMIKNLVRQRGLQRLAGRAHLTGSGMAFPWSVFATADLGGSNIVEDLALGMDLADRALPPMLVEQAIVWSAPASTSDTLVQRRRWEGGLLATSLGTAPSALARSIRRGDGAGLWAALDLCVPPLALLFVLNILALVLALGGALLGAALWPFVMQSVVGLFAFLALALAWSREGHRFASGATLLRLPLYVLWKVPLYFGLMRKGAPTQWVRTERN